MPIQKLRKIFLVLFIFVLFASSGVAQTAAKQASAGKSVEIKIPAPSLKGNLLNDPTEQNISIYLPPGYAASPSKRYPVVYLLHGFAGSNKTWTTDGDFSFNVPPIMDRLIAGGKMREMILVAPNANNAYNGSFYVNSTVTGNWEDYIFRDVVGYVDKNYRTLARASSRAIAGHSMGGFGAVAVGMKHAEIFSIIYALSPTPLGHEEGMNNPPPVWKLVGSYTARDQLKSTFDSEENLYANLFAALSAAFSPNATRQPFYADFPWQERDGKLQLNEAVAAKWKSKTPLYMIDEYKQNLLSLRGLVIECGRKDAFGSVLYNAPLFSKALAERGIPHIFEIYDGTHEDKIKERLEKKVLPFLSEKLDFTNP